MQYDVHNIRPLICLSCVTGSKAYGLDTPTSDDDFKGVYMARLEDVLSGCAPKVVQDSTHDRQYTELGEFLRQLELNNSGALELWACIGQRQQLYCAEWLTRFFIGRHPLSKVCAKTYVGNALAQLKRIHATHDKATMTPPTPATLADFARVLNRENTEPLNKWMETACLTWKDIAARPMGQNVWALYRQNNPVGLFGRDGTNVACPAINAASTFLACMQVDTMAYAAHCRTIAQYHEWQEKRNKTRLQTDKTLPADEGNYDTKHMMHVLRLLHTAREIATEGCIHVLRTYDNALLRDIRAGRIPFSEALQLVQCEIADMKSLFEKSTLPDTPQLGDWKHDLAQLRILRHNESEHH